MKVIFYVCFFVIKYKNGSGECNNFREKTQNITKRLQASNKKNTINLVGKKMLIYGITCVKLLIEIYRSELTQKIHIKITKGDNMGACLGVYLGEKIIKYAKLEQDEKTKRISLSSYGTKYVWGKKEDEIADIIAQTGSDNASVCLNLQESYLLETEILKQLKKSDVQSVIALEVSDSAAQRGINDKLLAHRYTLVDSNVSSANSHALIEVVNKADVDKLAENKNIKKLAGIYPTEFVLNRVTTQQNNYILLNVDEEATMIFVSNNVPVAVRKLDVSMKQILDTLAIQEGSYSKACDLCRTINVLSDESLDYKLESVIEPVIQDLLNRVGATIEETKFRCGKIILNGLINLFINIEMLFEQFFGIDTEKLKPAFLSLDEATVNMSEVIETNEAIALAYEGIVNYKKEMNFYSDSSAVATSSKDKFNIANLFKKKDGDNKSVVLPNISKEQIERVLLFSNLTAASLFVGYGAFSAIYNGAMTSMENTLTTNIAVLSGETAKVQSDITYVNGIKGQYDKYNQYITETVQKIKEGKIGKYTTYNVANFMQKIAKYIPTNVELQSISSNDNKRVVIMAKSTSYAELGYFISQLKLKGILENVATDGVQHGTYITVTIGGELP